MPYDLFGIRHLFDFDRQTVFGSLLGVKTQSAPSQGSYAACREETPFDVYGTKNDTPGLDSAGEVIDRGKIRASP